MVFDTNNKQVKIPDPLALAYPDFVWGTAGAYYTTLAHVNDVAAESLLPIPIDLISSLGSNAESTVSAGLEYASSESHSIDFSLLKNGESFSVLAIGKNIVLSVSAGSTINGNLSTVIESGCVQRFIKIDPTTLNNCVGSNGLALDNTKIFSRTIPGNLSATLYDDDYVTISWQGIRRQPQFMLKADAPKGGWGRPCIGNLKIDGSTSTTTTRNTSIRRVGARQIASTGVSKYFSPSGGQITAIDMENYGSYLRVKLMREVYTPDFPVYIIEFDMGDNASLAYTFKIINPPE